MTTDTDDTLVRELHGYIQQLKAELDEARRLQADMQRQLDEARITITVLMAPDPPRPQTIWDCFDHTPRK